MAQLIGLTGPANCGKDTIAAYLCRAYGYQSMAFAEPLKQTAAVLFNLPEIYFHDRRLKDEPLPEWDDLSPRSMLQLLGTEGIREVFGAYFWVKRWRMEYEEMRGRSDVVVTDVRFGNEAQAIRDLGGIIVHVTRPMTDNGLGADERNHASEAGVSCLPGDLRLTNGSTISALYERVDSLLSREGV